ncbi:cytochrome P450 [Annulohypoxylon maeteangense]|uniref:cytochrome P450 n=1 Tax=Annulohypoxylon maeteangense TaxID=1927788 RepID=UPI0020076804|nr:cytochrome P450 [Annulohypoxylon maeteangense]KAI0886384.1 cytochrome P450 [Annulohypoxylon maeteangense]
MARHLYGMNAAEVFTSGVTYLVCLAAVWCFLIVIYRLAIHPLRRYPGPILGGISDAYGGYLAFTRSDHLAIYQLHQRYGPVLRLAPDKLLFNSLHAFKDIYQNPRITKSYLYLYSRDKNQPTTFSTIDAEAHRQRRKLISQPISQRAMRLFEPTMSAQIDIFLRKIYESSGSVVNVTDHCQWLGLDIVGLLAFGYHLNLQTKEEYRFIPRAFADIKSRIHVFMQFPALANFAALITPFTEPEKGKLLRLVYKMMLARAEQDKDAERDFYSYAKGNLDYGPDYFEYGEFMAEAAFFVTAGGTPPATAICGLLFYLARHPQFYKKLTEEIRGTYKRGHDIKGDAQLMGCQYLRACIDETLRISPPSLATLWRERDKVDTDDSPLVIDGHVIPPGTQVGVNLYALHHNEEYFPDSYSFIPDRWITQASSDNPESEAARARMQEAFVPFLVGSRSCAGKAMAYCEISIVIAKLLWHFDFESAPGDLGKLGEGTPGSTDGRGRASEYQLYDCNSATHDGPNLIFRPRAEAIAELSGKAL